MAKNHFIWDEDTGYKQLTTQIIIEQMPGRDDIQIKVGDKKFWVGFDTGNETVDLAFELLVATLHNACMRVGAKFDIPACLEDATVYPLLMEEFKAEYDTQTKE